MEEMEYRGLVERLRLYDEAVRLRRAGLGYKRISKVLRVKYGTSLNPGAICNWVKGRHHPLRRCNGIIEGPELAYVIGGWLGDVYKRQPQPQRLIIKPKPLHETSILHLLHLYHPIYKI